MNVHVRESLNDYGIDHVKSIPYFPQENDQEEATNNTLLPILSKMVYKEPKK